jgi:hypothetical protein
MITKTLAAIFNRDLTRLKKEIELYKNESTIWETDQAVSNSAGNLCLHLLGNLNTYIGAEFGKTGYIRDRPLEFTLKNVPAASLIEQIDGLIQVIKHSLEILTEEDYQQLYPIQVFDEPCTTEYLLIHLTCHLNYHLGQINYHRRLLDR